MENKILQGDCLDVLKNLPDKTVNCCVTSPPYYGLRDYGVDGQVGLEESPEKYVEKMVKIFREVKRVLKDDGTLWLNLGDSYSGSCQTGGVNSISGNGKSQPHVKHKRNTNLKPKDLVGIPWMVAFALRADGWYLRQDIIWHKPNPMPESVKDRCVKSHEYIFLLSKSKKYYFDYEAIQEEALGYDGRKDTTMKGSEKYSDGEYLANGNANSLAVKGRERWNFKNLSDKGQPTHSFHEKRAEGKSDELYPVRNKRSVWSVSTKPYKEAHFATYPEKLIEPCIIAGCPKGGIVLDPFSGAGTTALVCKNTGRNYLNIELNNEYIEIQKKRLSQTTLFDLNNGGCNE